MKIQRLLTLPVLLILALTPAESQNNYVVGIASTGSVQSLASAYQLTVLNDLSGRGGPFLVTPVPGASVAPITTAPAVVSFEPDLPAISSETNPSAQTQAIAAQLADALAQSSLVSFYSGQVRSAYIQQAASNILKLPAARQITTGAGIVAVIDTGVDPNHPALAGVLVPGYDFTRNLPTIPNELDDLDPVSSAGLAYSSTVPEINKTQGLQLQGSTVVILDGSTVAILDGASIPAAFGHGTMTAGLIHLVAPTASIMPLKAFRSDGSANMSDIVRAIYFAVNNGAQVINMSFDIQVQSPQLQGAIAYATSMGVICVAAAGNEGQKELTYPSSLPKVIGVGSINNSGQRSLFSNYGTASVFMAAPGEGLITTFPGGNYAGVWGTSFSAALVSGTVASMLQLNPDLAYHSAIQALSAGPPLPSQQLGNAQLDVLRTVTDLLDDDDEDPCEE